MISYQYTFEQDRLFLGPAHAACRQAALWPLIAASARKKKEPLPSLLQAYAKLHDLWRHRLEALAAGQWIATRDSTGYRKKEGGKGGQSGERRYTYLHNCPPFSIAPTPGIPKANACQRVRVCPMCFARQVTMEAFKAVEWAFFMDAKLLIMPNVKLVAVRRTFPSLGPGPAENDTYQRPRLADFWMTKLSKARDKEIVGAVRGALSVSTLAPAAEGDGYDGRRSTLLALPVGTDISALKAKPATEVREFNEVTRVSIGKAVAWAIRYPIGMMFGDVPRAVDILHASSSARTKMMLTTGAMRNRSMREAVNASYVSDTDELD